jgi:hypothetical protein
MLQRVLLLQMMLTIKEPICLLIRSIDLIHLIQSLQITMLKNFQVYIIKEDSLNIKIMEIIDFFLIG